MMEKRFKLGYKLFTDATYPSRSETVMKTLTCVISRTCR